MSNIALPKTEMEMLYQTAKMSVQAANAMTKLFQESMTKVTNLNVKVDELLNSTQLQDHERYNIQNLIAEKVNKLIKDNSWCKSARKFIFPDYYRMLKAEFKVPKYGNILRSDYKKAIELINAHDITAECIEKIAESRRT